MQWLQASSAGFRLRSWDMDESLETMTLRTVPTKDGSVFVTWVNFHFADFAVSWAENLRRNGIENMYIGAMDADTTRVRVVGCEGATEGVREVAGVCAAAPRFGVQVSYGTRLQRKSPTPINPHHQVMRERGFPTFAMYPRGQNNTGLTTGTGGAGEDACAQECAWLAACSSRTRFPEH